MDSEKKFRLDELPDEGKASGGKSSTPEPTSPRQTARLEPRIKNLKGKSLNLKAQIMEQKWLFDKEEYRWGWLIFIASLVALQKLPHYHEMLSGFEYEFVRYEIIKLLGIHTIVLFPFRYPLIFIVLTPFLFSFKVLSPYWFEVTFDGISTVQKLSTGTADLPIRVFIKWSDIAKVEGHKAPRKSLHLYSPQGKLGELIWDLTAEKKAAALLVLQGLVKPSHPLRAYLEKEAS